MDVENNADLRLVEATDKVTLQRRDNPVDGLEVKLLVQTDEDTGANDPSV